MYYFLKATLYLWSLLPMGILYVQSRMLAFIVGQVVGYRKEVIRENLRQAFPEKSDPEIRKIQRQFYLHFCDVIVETIKLMSISRTAIQKRVRLTNPEILQEMIQHGRGGVAVFSHFGNWEWLAAGLGRQIPVTTYGVYKPLRSKTFDRLMLHIRTRHGNGMIPQKETLRRATQLLKEPCYIGFLGDQNPDPQGKFYFTPFFGRLVPTHLGIATIALRLNAPLYYFDLRRLRRGYYELTLVKLQDAGELPFSKSNIYTTTDKHVQYLEAVIRDNPPYWLWSHRRWKRYVREHDVVSDRWTPGIEN